MGICCMTQGLWDNLEGGMGRWGGSWEGGSGGRGHGCNYGWFLLMYDRNPQHSVKQWSPNKKKKKKNKRILECVALPFSRGSSQPRDWTCISHIADRFFSIWDTREAPKFLLYPSKSIKASNGKTKNWVTEKLKSTFHIRL